MATVLMIIVQILSVLAAGYMIITKILPIFKGIMLDSFKDGKVPKYVLTFMVIYVGIFMLKFIASILSSVNEATYYVMMIMPGLDLLTSSFFIWIFTGLILIGVFKGSKK